MFDAEKRLKVWERTLGIAAHELEHGDSAEADEGGEPDFCVDSTSAYAA